MNAVGTLVTGQGLVESPRWHDDRLYFSDWSAGEVLGVDLAGDTDVVARVKSLPLCTAWLPDGRLVIVSSPDGRLLRREPDGSLVTHADLGETGWNDIVVDGRGNAYVNRIGFNPMAAAEFTPGLVHLATPAGSVRQVADDIAFLERDGGVPRQRHPDRRGLIPSPPCGISTSAPTGHPGRDAPLHGHLDTSRTFRVNNPACHLCPCGHCHQTILPLVGRTWLAVSVRPGLDAIPSPPRGTGRRTTPGGGRARFAAPRRLAQRGHEWLAVRPTRERATRNHTQHKATRTSSGFPGERIRGLHHRSYLGGIPLRHQGIRLQDSWRGICTKHHSLPVRPTCLDPGRNRIGEERRGRSPPGCSEP